MNQRYLVYGLHNGYIHDWLVLGPAMTPVAAPPHAGEAARAYRARLLAATDRVTCDFPQPPQELEKIARFGEPLYWEAAHCQDDHLVEKDVTPAVYSHVRAWAFTRLSCQDWPRTHADGRAPRQPAAQPATLTFTLCCPASVWLNGRHVAYFAHIAAPDDQTSQTYACTANLTPGDNDLLVRLEQIAAGDAVLALAVRVEHADTVQINVPTITEDPAARQEWEAALTYAHLDQAVYQRQQAVAVVCDSEMPGVRAGSVRLQQPDGVIYGRLEVTFQAGARFEGLIGAQMAAGPMQALLTPPIEDYYAQGFRARRALPFTVNTGIYTSEPAEEYDDRLVAVIREAARGYDPLYAEIAKLALGWWSVLDPRGIRRAIDRVRGGELGGPDDLLGLVMLRRRMGHYAQFPADLLAEIDACLLAFDYDSAAFAESDQLTRYAAQIVAGQLYDKQKMPGCGAIGRKVRQRGERLAAVWLRRRGQTGFALWNAQADRSVVGLALLADAANSQGISGLATVLLDKLLFGLAVNSFRGAYAAPRTAARASWLRSAALAPEAPLNYLLWGMGGLNAHLRGAVSLGLAGARYRAPELLRAIALDQWPAMLSRERQKLADNDYVNTIVFKTPDYLLASAQDYRPGQAGRRQHIWQATLGCDALVFANHPTSFSDADARPAGWWCGNGRLPRVAQRKDALIALYNLPADDVLGFTHAFFPAYAFDEHVIEAGWAFARKGDGYLALCATAGMALAAAGDDAGRELRSAGPRNAWLCQMGRAATDGNFADFRRAVLAGRVAADGLQVAWDTIRGERLEFGWAGPLLVNGTVEPIAGFKHIENPYALAEFPAQSMDIGYGEDILRLDFT